MENRPVATIIIVTRNREKILHKMLEEIRKQKEYDLMEIIVGNDGGKIDAEKLKKTFPEIKFFDFPEHKGLVKVRNDLFKIAGSGFVFFLDDDAWPEEKDAVTKALRMFEKYPEAGILNFAIRLSGGKTIPDDISSKTPYDVAVYFGGANAIRKKFFNNSDIYDEHYFRQGEERDLAIKCLDKGFRILQINEIAIYHDETDILTRDHQLIHRYAFRNELFFYLKYFPAIPCFIFVIKCLISHFIYCLTKAFFKAYFLGLADFIRDSGKFLRRREPVKPATIKKYVALRYFGENSKP
ncbi:MAG: glycosyltransferase [Candidatus Omnitrophica bacterium]|nr:glycosyltransferase [Candidatus Omnitrophota bacterium]